MSINVEQFRKYVIQDTLKPVGLWSPEAEELLIGTAAHESQLGNFIAQVNGPALGVFQMEPATCNDIFNNFLSFRPALLQTLENAYGIKSRHPRQLATDLRYACIMARLKYYRVKETLPAANDLEDQARYWKQYYNTPLGAGTVDQYINDYHQYVNDSLY